MAAVMYSPQYQQVTTTPQEHQPPFPTTSTTTVIEQKAALRPVWKFLAALPPNFLLIGYLILPVAFQSPESNPQVDKTAITTVASVFIALAYIASLALGLAQSHNGPFVIQHVCLPCLYSSLLSLFNVVFNIIARNLFPLNSLEKMGMGLSSACGVVYVLAALWIYGKDVTPGDARSGSDDATALLTEEEMQRQQLRSLLEQGRREGMKSPSPRAMQKTFRVDGPEHLNVGNNDWDRYKYRRPPRDAAC